MCHQVLQSEQLGLIKVLIQQVDGSETCVGHTLSVYDSGTVY